MARTSAVARVGTFTLMMKENIKLYKVQIWKMSNGSFNASGNNGWERVRA